MKHDIYIYACVYFCLYIYIYNLYIYAKIKFLIAYFSFHKSYQLLKTYIQCAGSYVNTFVFKFC